MKKTAILAIAAAVIFPALALGSDGPMVTLSGNANFWWVVQEQVENGRLQQGTLDPAVDEASGFNFKQGRLGVHFLTADGKVEGMFKLRLEERTDVIDAWGAYHVADWLGFYVGLMKIPSTGEVLTPDQGLDFITRTTFAKMVGDYSLSRTPYISLLMAQSSNNRDMGVAFKGKIGDDDATQLRYFLMISNGIGGNFYVGGEESPEYFYTNKFGEYFYGARLELQAVPEVTLGGHYSYNKHEDALYDDKKTVFDIDREAWSADLLVKLPWGTRIYGFYGEGHLDDLWVALNYIYDYKGYGGQVVQAFFDDRLELGIRYDEFSSEFDENGDVTDQKNWTFGANFSPSPSFRIQANYVDKNTVNDFTDDQDDNIFFINMQFLFDVSLSPAI